MCGVWNGSADRKLLESKRDKSSWLVIYFENIQLIQVNHFIYKRRRCFGSSLYCKRWKMVGKGWKRFYKKKEIQSTWKSFSIVWKSFFFVQLLKKSRKHFSSNMFFTNFHNQIFICQRSRRWVGLYAARTDLQTPHSRLGTPKHHDKDSRSEDPELYPVLGNNLLEAQHQQH